MLSFKKYDKTGQELKPGDVCVRMAKSKHDRVIEFCVYKGDTRGNNATGKYGRFQTPSGLTSIKYTSVIFAFNPLSERRNHSEQVISVVRGYFESK